MPKEFAIDEKKLKLLAGSFEISEESCNELFSFYRAFVPLGAEEPLLDRIASSIKKFIKEKRKNTLAIKFVPLSPRYLCGNDFTSRYNRGSRFTVYFDPSLPEGKRKIIFAKELWRLFFLEEAEYLWKHEHNFRKCIGAEHNMWPLAHLFGIFTIADENCSCQSVANAYAFEDLVKEFQKLVK